LVAQLAHLHVAHFALLFAGVLRSAAGGLVLLGGRAAGVLTLDVIAAASDHGRDEGLAVLRGANGGDRSSGG
jgi:hypothetical protein